VEAVAGPRDLQPSKSKKQQEIAALRENLEQNMRQNMCNEAVPGIKEN
jgi:hypothetical protein